LSSDESTLWGVPEMKRDSAVEFKGREKIAEHLDYSINWKHNWRDSSVRPSLAEGAPRT